MTQSQDKQNKDIKLYYGLRDGKLVSIVDLSPEEKGLKCGCVCPHCGTPLQARLGAVRRHHYAHHNTNCDPSIAQQTVLHMLAKELIEEEKRVLIPGLSISINDFFSHDPLSAYRDISHKIYEQLPSEIQYKRPVLANGTSVRLEKRISGIIPDIIIEVGNKQCLIEIAVTHFVDDEKEEKIKSIGLPTFEIDLSDLHIEDLNRDLIRDTVLYGKENRKWLYNPLQNEAMQYATKEYERLIQEGEERLRKEQDRYDKIRKEKELKKQIEAEKRVQREEIIRDLFEPEHYKKQLLELRDDTAALQTIHNCLFWSQSNGTIPFFIDIPIKGEMVFQCDRRIWQSILFDKFIYNRQSTPHYHITFSIKIVRDFLKNSPYEIRINWNLVYQLNLGEQGKVQLLYDVLKKYFDYMDKLGFIETCPYDKYKVVAPFTIDPIYTQYALDLQSSLASLNLYVTTVDEVIEARISWQEHMRKKREEAEYARLEKLQKETEQKNIYNDGYTQIQFCDFLIDQQIRDSYGNRWLKCKKCSRIKRCDEMSTYGGRGNMMNTGICKECDQN